MGQTKTEMVRLKLYSPGPSSADQLSYIVDFEVCDDYSHKPEHEFKFSDHELIFWCLARQNMKDDSLIL